jgi:hypothetical protein
MLFCAGLWGSALAGVNTAPATGVAICTVELGHFDRTALLGGPSHPLPDGCRIEVIEDCDRDGTASAADRILTPRTDAVLGRPDAQARTNGLARLHTAGCFLLNLTVELATGSALYFRVYDTPDSSARGYWQSPFYLPLPGSQQISFSGAEWTYVAAKSLPAPGPHRAPVAPPAHSALSVPGALLSYPNPFNSTAAIAFDLERPAQVQLRVFDLTGRQVRTLLDGTLDAGSHQVAFDAEGLPSGTYLVTLNRDHHAALVTRVMLVR